MEIKEIYLGERNLSSQAKGSNSINLDFKVVSFNIGNDNYLVDIMKVKEIRKSSNFTYVPNARRYVVGLDNLRGEIISIIDLRIMFNLEVIKKELEDIMILRNGDLLVGVIVDKVNNVFSIDSSLIQDPHPVLSQESLIGYIKGVVEYGEKLYILLDVDKIFDYDEENEFLDDKSKDDDINALEYEDKSLFSSNHSLELPESSFSEYVTLSEYSLDDLKIIKDNLFKYSFNASLVNDEFLKKVAIKLDIANINDLVYDNFLSEFYSKSSGLLWDDKYLKEFQDEIVKKHINTMNDVNSILNVFEIGCGDGKETMSFVNALYDSYKNLFKVTAIDNDLIKVISTANLTFSESEISMSEVYRKNSFEQDSGVYKFKPEVMNSVLFEYSDAILSEFPENLGVIFLRDILCFLNDNDQVLILDMIAEKSVKGAILILGDNEELKNNNIFVKDRSVEYFNLYKRI
ncbi:chemotaxis protein CheW [Borrelia miyamotoi]|uniref:Chemotaxis protein CheW n=1 Tax=Borrelia miyamotoi TaxID=47466 RepID=A0AAX3JN40_9SPIR|nr:CheR family methyltransferase [Borrelia miyamotoi]QFP47821.2 CheR family methyltransferase [Borrelia miyamotoi]WAZ72212.1 chemotaxis protein CheW [Borrelia miyamotoi]